MPLKPSKNYLSFLAITLAFAMQACRTYQKPVLVMSDSSTESSPFVESLPTSPTSTVKIDPFTAPTMMPTSATIPSPTIPVVTVTARNGDLSIRSGPDVSFDAIAALKDGETATVLARSILDGWVQIPIPSQPGKTGWVSILTEHSIVIGNVLDLLRIDLVEWPVGSYVVNCTQHQIIVKPSDRVIPSVEDSPKNRVWFTPGLYMAYDADMSSQPVVMNLKLSEHSEVSVHKDGNGQYWDCP